MASGEVAGPQLVPVGAPVVTFGDRLCICGHHTFVVTDDERTEASIPSPDSLGWTAPALRGDLIRRPSAVPLFRQLSHPTVFRQLRWTV